MLNQIILVGRVIDIPTPESEERATIEIAVQRTIKNLNGEYESDNIKVILFKQLSNATLEYLHKGDIVGIKGRIQTDENKNIQIVAEKLTFLTSSKKED